MGRCYERPPIVEAVCQFDFDPGSPWDMTFPGLIYGVVKNDFPHKSTERGRITTIQLAGAEDMPTVQSVQPAEKARFQTENRDAMVQVGKHLLTVHRLEPYTTWDDYKPQIRLGLDAYLGVASPVGLGRIGLRYINDITLPHDEMSVGDYFDFFPNIGDRLPQKLRAFICGVRIEYEDGRDNMSVQMTTEAPKEPGTNVIRLDLNYSMVRPGEIKLDEALDWVQVAHDRVEEVFEGCLKDRTRTQLGEIKS